MNILLIIVLIYFISVIISHIIAYIYWSYNDSKGCTLADMYNYIYKETNIPFALLWFPFVNTVLLIAFVIGIITGIILYIILFVIIKLKYTFLNFIGKFANIKIK